MNWKFWQRITPAIAPVLQPTLDYEQALLKDVYEKPDAWVLREWRDGVVRKVRADSRGVTVLSGPGEINIDAAFDVRVTLTAATCGALDFSPEFAHIWHTIVLTRVQEKARHDLQVAQDRVATDLRSTFVGP